jgi:hypothetical protein
MKIFPHIENPDCRKQKNRPDPTHSGGSGPLPIVTIFPPNIHHSFSYFMIDLHATLRYNISIKKANSSTHSPYFCTNRRKLP